MAQIVGWTCDQEWAQVYHQVFFGTLEEKRHALDILEVWRLRFGDRTPVAIEATFRLLDVLVNCSKMNNSLRQQTMAAALIQVVGLTTEPDIKNPGDGINIIGGTIGLPDWLLALRNQIAHGPIPSPFMLESGVQFCFNWIKESHWDALAEKNLYFTLSIPYMSVNVSADFYLTLDGRISFILENLYEQLQLNESSDKASNLIAKLDDVCERLYAAQRLCVIFVLREYYEFEHTTDASDLHPPALTDRVFQWWTPILNIIDSHHLLPVLFYCFLFQLNKEHDHSKQLTLVAWSLEILGQLASINGRDLIWIECVKLLLKKNDHHTKYIFEHLSKHIGNIFNEVKLSKLNALNSVFDVSNFTASKCTPSYSNVYSIDDVLSKVKSKPLDKTSEQSNLAETWQLYNGKSLASCPIGLMPHQHSNTLPCKLYKFKSWSLHKYTALDTSFDSVDYSFFDCVNQNSYDSSTDEANQPFVEAKSELASMTVETSNTVNKISQLQDEDWENLAATIDVF